MTKTSVSGILVALLCVLALASCGNAPTLTVSSDTIGYSNAKTTITWLPQEGLDSPNKPVADYLAATTKAWVMKHPDVKIVVAAQGNQIQDAMAKMLVQAAAGNAPDIASVDSFILPSFWDVLQPVDDILQAKKIPLDSWFPFAQQLMKPKDKILAMWYDTDVRMFYYQKALIKVPPKNWDELFAVAKEMKGKGYVPFLYPAGRNETTSCDVLPWFWSQGGKLVDDAGNPVFYDGANKTAMLNVFNFMKKTITTGITPTRVTTYTTDGDMNTEIASGKVAMFLGGSWLVKQLYDIMGEQKFRDTWELAPIPMEAGGARTTTSGGWTVGVFSKDDAKRKLAADLGITIYVDDQGNAGYAKASGNLPARKTVFEQADFLKNDPIAQKFKDELTYATVRPGVRIYNVISTDLQVAISDTITGRASPEKTLETAWNDSVSQAKTQK